MSALKVLREVNNYTQEYVAEHIGVDQSTYSKIERNARNLRADQAEKLSELYNVGIADILSPEGLTFHFSGNIEKNNGYVQNNYEEQKDSVDKIIQAKDDAINAYRSEIKSLKEEIEYLRTQNKQLLELVGKK